MASLWTMTRICSGSNTIKVLQKRQSADMGKDVAQGQITLPNVEDDGLSICVKLAAGFLCLHPENLEGAGLPQNKKFLP